MRIRRGPATVRGPSESRFARSTMPLGIPREGERGSLKPGDLSTRARSALRREGTRAFCFGVANEPPSLTLGCTKRGFFMRHARVGRARLIAVVFLSTFGYKGEARPLREGQPWP